MVQPTSFDLEKLIDTTSGFSTSQCDMYCECCIVVLEKNNHSTGCTLTVTGDNNKTFNLDWKKGVMKAGYREPKKLVEHAAETISFF